ncbi:MAG: glycosyltransferase [Clostridia bacterium]
MRRADISIAMATYNGSRFLAEQIQSLADQTVPPMELVVADDGSTDGTLELLERLRDGVPFPIRVLKPVGHVGYVQGFLRAARECRGSAIAYCDQDDV